MAKILSIKEYEELKDFNLNEYEGYVINLSDNSSIIFCIENYSRCCEDFGYFSSECNFDDFIGAELIEFKVVEHNDKGYPSHLVDVARSKRMTIEDCVFLVLKTSKGELDFAVYNCHNGYYGHDVVVRVLKAEDIKLLYV